MIDFIKACDRLPRRLSCFFTRTGAIPVQVLNRRLAEGASIARLSEMEPVRAKKAHQNENLEPGSSIGAERAYGVSFSSSGNGA